jgi:hypothetical protein
VYRRHHRLREPDTAADDLDNRRDAIRRATRAGDDGESGSRHVRTVDYRFYLSIFRRRRQQDNVCARKNVLLEIRAPRQRPSALEHHLDVELLPGKV